MSDSVDKPAILLVAGSSHTQNSITRLLTSQFTILSAETSAEAWEVLQKKHTVSVVIAELPLVIDRSALLQRIRRASDKLLAGMPVMLLVSEEADEKQTDESFKAGATDFINMPFSSVELKSRVRLHARLYGMYHAEKVCELAQQGMSHDVLENLMKESYFNSRLEQELGFSIRHRSFLSVCLMKIDNADQLRSEYGDKVVKAVVKSVAKLIDHSVRREDSFAYFGEQTFALLFPVTNAMGAHVAVHRLMEKLEKLKLKHDKQVIPLSLCAGFQSTLPSEHESLDQIMEAVESRLESAQKQGDGAVVGNKSEQQTSILSLDQATNMIKFRKSDGLDKQMPNLLEQLLPLLQFARQHNEQELQAIFDELNLTQE